MNNTETETPTIGDVRRGLRQGLIAKYGEREAAAMAREIILHLKGWSVEQLLADENREASEYVINRSQEILQQLLKDVPLQYILGEAYFYGLKLKVVPGTLIPRPETTELVDLIVKENPQADLRVLDLCTGTGAIAVALARNLRFPQITAIDISDVAVKTTLENSRQLKVKLNVEQGDVFKLTWPKDSFDIIVSNPPYVDESERATMERNVLDYEPAEALFVPDDNPLVFYTRIADIGNESLSAGGRLYFEINPRHAAELSALLAGKGYSDIRVIKDINGKDRFAKAVKKV
ncbi:MAG: peptide chain release factor N(5)-glutamine methyltransferase [Muribaculaceae bacterium]|nr:peptide chain release factor N(5)-glutamine methyltransferase [Muribaculaceae bacterium]